MFDNEPSAVPRRIRGDAAQVLGIKARAGLDFGEVEVRGDYIGSAIGGHIGPRPDRYPPRAERAPVPARCAVLVIGPHPEFEEARRARNSRACQANGVSTVVATVA